MTASNLTPKQKRFADEYLIDLNATAAYKRSGYKGTGDTARVNACRLLANANVELYIASRQSALQEKTGITQARVLAEYAKIAFLDPRKFYNAHGGLIPIPELDDDTAAALAGMDIAVERDGNDADGRPQYSPVHKIKMIDKKGALDSIARTLGMFKDKFEASGPNGGPIEITRIERIIKK